jgi:hypothetical protein
VILTLNYYLRRFLEGLDEDEDDMSVDKKAVTFEKATEVRQVDSHTYEVNLESDWCIGTGKLSKFRVRYSKKPSD